MDSKHEPIPPGQSNESAVPWWGSSVGLLLFTALMFGPLLVLAIARYDLTDVLIRPLALRYGKPATAVVSSKWSSTGRYGGNYLTLNYQYSPDYAPRPELKVNAAAYAAVAKDSHVPIHFIPGCSSCIALDDDYGTARQRGTMGLFFGGLFSLFALFRLYPIFRRVARS
jgi:hypothetical protein